MRDLDEFWWEKPPQTTHMDEWFDWAYHLCGIEREWDDSPPGGQLLARHDAVPVLIEMLSYPDSRVRRWAGFYLHNVIEPAPKEAFPALLETWRRYKGDFRGSEKHWGWEFGNAVDAEMCIYTALTHADPKEASQGGVYEEDPDNAWNEEAE